MSGPLRWFIKLGERVYFVSKSKEVVFFTFTLPCNMGAPFLLGLYGNPQATVTWSRPWGRGCSRVNQGGLLERTQCVSDLWPPRSSSPFGGKSLILFTHFANIIYSKIHQCLTDSNIYMFISNLQTFKKTHKSWATAVSDKRKLKSVIKRCRYPEPCQQ